MYDTLLLGCLLLALVGGSSGYRLSVKMFIRLNQNWRFVTCLQPSFGHESIFTWPLAWWSSLMANEALHIN